MENKTISYIKSKAWYRLIKVIYILIFVLIFSISNLAVFSSRAGALDYDKTIVVCNKTDWFSADAHQITLNEVNPYVRFFDDNEFDNFIYANYITKYSDHALILVDTCIGKDGPIATIQVNAPQFFYVRPAYSYTGFIQTFLISNFIIAASFFLIRGTFYYIALGKFRPEK